MGCLLFKTVEDYRVSLLFKTVSDAQDAALLSKRLQVIRTLPGTMMA